jgi:lauroyl/myristoyl acyltransferase
VRASADPEQALTQTLNNVIEAHIRAWPEQWAWNHRRWLHEPSRGSD